MAIEFRPIWFDSLGAKSSCTLVKTPDATILIDPGCAAMQPSYPLPDKDKLALLEQAFAAITEAAKQADYIIITHYHHDHYLEFPELYVGKRVWLKDPNRWINRSQWARAREFLASLAEAWGSSLSFIDMKPRAPADLACNEDPLKDLKIAVSKDFGSYQRRREELLQRGRERFARLRRWWLSEPWVAEQGLRELGIEFADGRVFQVGKTIIRFTEPLFHGIEYANTGWVVAVVIEHRGERFIYSSDLEGPTIEDYAAWIISERPRYLILDGPSTYLLGYMLNRTNLNRAIENARRIARECEPELEVLIFDHHLLRDRRYRERTAAVWEASPKVITAAEWLGERPLLERL